MTIQDYIRDGKTDAEIVAADAADESLYSDREWTLADLADAAVVALGDYATARDALDSVLTAIASSQSAAVRAVGASLSAGGHVKIGPAIRETLKEINTPAALAVLSIARTRPVYTLEQVAAERVAIAEQAAKDTLSNQLASLVSVAQQAINDGTATTFAQVKALLA